MASTGKLLANMQRPGPNTSMACSIHGANAVLFGSAKLVALPLSPNSARLSLEQTATRCSQSVTPLVSTPGESKQPNERLHSPGLSTCPLGSIRAAAEPGGEVNLEGSTRIELASSAWKGERAG